MERLEKSAPTIKLSEEQKAQIAEIDSAYKARIAEKEWRRTIASTAMKPILWRLPA